MAGLAVGVAVALAQLLAQILEAHHQVAAVEAKTGPIFRHP